MENRKVLISIIILAALSRLVLHPANMAPITGIALFSGAKLNKKTAIILPLAAMFLSDLFLGFHPIMPFVYGSFILIAFIGSFLKNKSLLKIISVSITSSILFFIITNFGVWLMTTMYIKNFTGLINCYTMAIPFFRNTIVGDLIYTGIFFYGYEFLKTFFILKSWTKTIRQSTTY